MGRQGHSGEFRRKVLDLLAAGRSVASVAHDLDISDQTICTWRWQDRIDRGEAAGLSTVEKGELATANKRIRQLETELAIARRAVDLLKEETSPKRRFAALEVIAAEDRPVQVACRVLGLSEAEFYEHRNRKASERGVRHAVLADLISQTHVESRATYGARRVHAELTLGALRTSGGGSWGEATGGEEHSEAVVVGVAESSGEAPVEFDDAVDGLGAAVVRATSGEVRQERVTPPA